MPYSGRPGSTGGGGGLTLGPPQNSFSGSTRAAAETARNTYATTNASWLAQYDAEPTFTIIVSWPAVNPTNTIYQSRRGGSWADVTGLVRGPPGTSGQTIYPTYQRVFFQASATEPSAPTSPAAITAGDIPAAPAGWLAAPPSGDTPIWATYQTVLQGSLVVTYTNPVRWDGEDGTGTGGSGLVQLWTTGQSWTTGELARTARGSVYVAVIDIASTDGTAGSSPDTLAPTIWRQVDGFDGSWHSGIYLHQGSIVEHSGLYYIVRARIENGRTAPPDDTTNYQVIGSGHQRTATEIGELAFENPPSGLDSTQQTAVRTAILAGRGYVGAWSSVVSDFGFLVGDITQHGNQWYVCILTHTRSAFLSPNVSALQFEPLSTWAGAWSTGIFAHPGTIVTDGGHIWINTTAVLTSDPAPSAAANTKWVRIDNISGTSAAVQDYAVDVLTYFEDSTTRHTHFDAISIGADVVVGANQGNDEFTAQCRFKHRVGNILVLGLSPTSETSWNALLDGTINISSPRGTQIGELNHNNGQSEATDVDSDGDFHYRLDIPAAGEEAFREMERIESTIPATAGATTANLSIGSRTATTLQIVSSSGTNATVPSANNAQAGLLTATRNVKITALPDSWVRTDGYSRHDQVAYDGSIYIANKDIASASNNPNPAATPADWDPAGRQLTDVEEGKIADSSLKWAAAIHAIGDQTWWDGKLYECIVARIATDGQNPAADTTGWRVVSGASLPPADQSVIEGVAVDIIEAWIQDANLENFDALEFSTELTVLYGSSSVTATVLARYRNLNVGVLVIEPLAVWSDILAETATIIQHGSDVVTILGTANLQTSRGAVTALNEWWYAQNVGGAGEEVWRNLSRIEEEDNTHLTIGTKTATTLEIESSTGDDVVLPAATTTEAGLETAADKTLLSTLPAVWVSATIYATGAQRSWQGLIYECIADRQITDTDDPATDSTGWAPLTSSGTTDLAIGTVSTTTVQVTSSTGTNATIPAATTSAAGVLSAADKSYLAAPPRRWIPAVYADGDQVFYDNKLYLCTNARTAADSDNPATDTSSWEVVIGISDLSGYVTTATLGSYSTTTQVNTAITNAIDALAALTYQGAWSAASTYAVQDVVRHNGATYIALLAVAANTDATSEPGTGSNWTASWYRVGYSEGAPDDFTDVVTDDGGFTLQRRSGTSQRIVFPQGTETPYVYYAAPTLTGADSSSAQTIPTTGDGLEITILDAETFPGGVIAGRDFITEWEGGFSTRISATGTLFITLVTEHTVNGKSFTLTRPHVEDLVADTSVSVPLNVFNSRSRVNPGTYRGVTITEEDLNSEVEITYKLRFQLFGRRNTNRIAGDLSEIYFENLEVVSYQLGAFQGGAGRLPDETRIEDIKFQAIAQGDSDLEGVPLAANPVTVEYGGGDPELITNVTGNDFTLAAGIYIIEIEANASGNNNNPFLTYDIRRSSDNEVVGRTTAPRIVSTANDTIAFGRLVLREPTTVNMFVRRTRQQVALAANWTAVFIRIGGSGGFQPGLVGTDTFDLDGNAQEIALTDDTTNRPLVIPGSGFIITVATVPQLGLNGTVNWYLAEDLRAADSDNTLAAALYTNASHELVFHAGMQQAASTNNKIIVYHTGTTTEGPTPPPADVTPHIRTFRVTGDKEVPAGSIAGKAYQYESQISQPAHVAAARIVGFIGTSQAPTNPEQLVVINDYTDESGTIRIPEGVTLTADQVYTIREEVYPTGKTFDDPVTIYADYRITARAPTAQVHFGVVPFTDGSTIQQVIAAIDFDTHDISTAGQAAGTYTFTGLASGQQLLPYWAVPSSLTQPTSFMQNGFPVNAIVIGDAIDRTIDSVTYTIYHYRLDDWIDQEGEGVSTIVA